MRKIKIVFLSATLLIIPVSMMAQLGDPREKFGITAEIDGTTNGDHTWYNPSGDAVAAGTMKQNVNVKLKANIRLLKIKNFSVSLSPFYNFSNEKIDNNWGDQNLGFTLPSTFHHFGSSLGVNYQTKAFGKPLTLFGVGTGNFSEHGLENSSGMFGGMFTITANRNTHFALGAIFLMGTSVKWPLFPMFVYSHRFNNNWSVNCMTVNNYLYYHASPSVKVGAGMEIESNKHYFRHDSQYLPTKTVLSQLYERFGVFADWKASKSVSFNLGAGVKVPIFGRIQESGYNESFMDISIPMKPFLRMKMKVSIF